MIKQLIAFLLTLCFIFTQPTHAYTLTWLPHQPAKHSATVGSSESHSDRTQTNRQSSGSQINAGGNLSLVATAEKGEEGTLRQAQDARTGKGNLTIQGSDIKAGKDINLEADNKINLLAAQNTSAQTSSNKSSSNSIGLSANVGAKGVGFNVDAAASRGKGNGNGSDLTWSNTNLNAGNKLTLKSGGDTNLKGAVANGKQVVADVGGDLNIESLQDTSTYASKQENAGVNMSINVIGVGTNSGGLNYDKTKASGNYASVNQQSGIKAGDGGFQVTVKGNTDLKGGIISSSDQAIADNTNTLTTATLTQSELANRADASVETSGFNVSSDMFSQGKYGLAKGGLGNILKNDNMSSHSTGNTRSAISAGAITLTNETAQQTLTGQTAAQTIASLSRDTTTAHTAAQKQDVEAMKQDMATERLIEGEAFKQTTATADEAYKTMFTKNHALYEVTKNPDGTLNRKEVNGTDSLKTGEDGKVHLSTNGIFNSTGAATKYTGQHATDPGTQYLIAFPEANSPVAELFVAGYQKFLESDALGLTNSTTQVVDIMNQYGQSGLAINGHSRGSLTVGNAMDSLANQQNAAGRLNGTNINFFGPAMNVNNANATLSSLQNQNTMSADQKNNSVLRYMSHVADPIGGIIGWNDPTGGTIPRGNGTTVDWSAEGTGGSVSPGSTSLVWERLRAATGQENTSHNLYFVDARNLQPRLEQRERDKLIFDYWRSGSPMLQPAKN